MCHYSDRDISLSDSCTLMCFTVCNHPAVSHDCSFFGCGTVHFGRIISNMLDGLQSSSPGYETGGINIHCYDDCE